MEKYSQNIQRVCESESEEKFGFSHELSWV